MIRNKYHIQILLVVTLFSFYSCSSMAPFMKNKVDNSTRTFSADIYRDIMGVPHIFGKTDADAVFGLAYAHAEDDFKTIQDLLLGARGMLGAKYGVKFSPVDYYVELIGVWEDINNRYDDEIPESIKLICEAYAQGINQYAFEHQKEVENELFPIICSLIRVQSEEIRGLVQEILSTKVARVLGIMGPVI